jgi:transcription-repair coupling factor (superfamily II helicase)
MTLTGITHVLSNLPAVKDLRSRTSSAQVAGLLGAARPAVASALAGGRQMLVVTAHPQAAFDFASELRRWMNEPVGHFPAIQALPYERVRVDRSILAERESVVHDLASGSCRMVVAPVRALLQPIDRPHVNEDQRCTVRSGAAVRPDVLVAQWLRMGYVETRVVEDPGTFARRGGVIDVFPAGASLPVRVDLFGNDIESLREFDPSTQRSVSTITEVEILPLARLEDEVRATALRELTAADTSSLSAEAQTRWNEDLAALERGAGLDELAVFLPYLLASRCSLAEHFASDALVVVDNAQETWAVLKDLCEQAEEVQRGMEDSGSLPRGLRPSLLAPEELEGALRERVCLQFVAGTSSEMNAVDLSGVFTPAHSYAGRLRDFVRDMAKDSGTATVVATQQQDRLIELFADESIGVRSLGTLAGAPELGITIVASGAVQGWTLGAENLQFITDHEIFGRALTRPVPRKKRPAREAFFFDYSPGDYVVHLEHGIGRFEGVTRMEVDGAEREYVIVQYAGKDRVYVPTDQLERLTRYVGTGESKPQLSKLGGGEWQRARARAKAAAADIARELIELYAKRRTRPAHSFSYDQPWQRELESAFAYEETADQMQAIQDVKTDMEEPHPMDRLVCADVGYGKTEVAVRAAFKAVMDGKQVAVLVPTTILAQQHFETFSERYGPYPVTVEVLSRFRTPAQQRDILRRLATGEVDVVIGTHRLLQKDVNFKNLGLLIIDEEQRFGVKHKEQLKKFRESVDVLTLTATPIPRTLHSGLVGIREISVIETPPEGRLPIKTYLQPFDERLLREAILRELDRDGQVYIVHNKVATIDAMAERVRRLVPEARILVAHGQMDEMLLERAMLTFAHHEADVLICSTIIENGLDIPNVNTIVVNNAHRLGLTQLYQLRGRVGRSANQAYAYLLYPLDTHISHDAARRMEAVFEAQDLGAGFSIAMKDLEIRGTGNLLGAEQSGHATAIGFDLYTRMVGDAVEQLRGVPVEEPPSISMNLPLTTLLPENYIGSEAERLTMYRRLANVGTEDELRDIEEEMRDRFGALPEAVQNLLTVVSLKLMARRARVNSVTLDRESLTIRAQPGVMFDRVSLYRKYATDAKISNALLKIPRHRLGNDWIDSLQEILRGMAELHEGLAKREAVPV